MTYIAYDKETNQILCFITTNDKINTGEVFSNFENYNTITTHLEIPNNYSEYKVVIEANELISFELLEQEDEKIKEENIEIEQINESEEVD